MKTYNITNIDTDSGFFTVENDSRTFEIQFPITGESQVLYNDEDAYSLIDDNKNMKRSFDKAVRDVKAKHTNTELSIAAHIGHFNFVYEKIIGQRKDAYVVIDQDDYSARYFQEGSASKYYNVSYVEPLCEEDFYIQTDNDIIEDEQLTRDLARTEVELRTRNIVKRFKEYYALHTNKKIDFRSDVFLQNSYGAVPQMSYQRAEDIMKNLYNFLDEIEYTRICNFDMDMEALKTTPLKTFIEDIGE